MVKISDAELEVMKIIWRRKRATSGEIIEDLKGVKWSFNTIRTLIKRLQIKGAIEIVKKEGKIYTYSATIKEEDYKLEVAKKLLKKLYNSSISDFVLQYCEDEEMNMQELQELNKSISEIVLKNQKKNKSESH